jgi:hypothetical protein
MEKIMQSKWLTVLGILILCLELAFTGCQVLFCSYSEEDGDEVLRDGTSYTLAEVGAQAVGDLQLDLEVTEWIYTTGIYTPNGFTSVSAQGSPFVPILEEHGYLGIKVPHPIPTYTSKVLCPTARFSYKTYPTGTEKLFTIPVEYRADLASKVESKYPSGPNAHWEVWWSQQGHNWPEPTEPFERPEAAINYGLDFGGTPCWGCYLEYLMCVDDICAGPFRERIVNSITQEGALVEFLTTSWVDIAYAQAVTPGLRFTKTHVLCNYDTIPHTYTLDYSSSEQWSYEVYTREMDLTRPAVPANTARIGPKPECKMVELAATTNATDTVDTVLITATSQMSSDVYAPTWNLVFTPWVTPTLGEDVYLPTIMKTYTTTVSAEE